MQPPPPPPPPPSRRNQPPHQQNQHLSRQGGQNKFQPQTNNYEGSYYEQFPSPPRVTSGRRSSSQPQQDQQAYLGQQNTTNLSGEFSWMNTSRIISTPTISRLTGAAGGGNGIGSSILPLPPPPGLGQGTTGRGSSMLLVEDPPTVNSTFPRGVEGATPWRGGGGAFGAPRAASGASLHSGGPYRGPTPPTPGSSLAQPSYHQQDQQSYEYSVGNAFNTPHYPSQSTAESSCHLRFGQEYVPETESPRSALPPSFIPAPETARILRQQSAGSSVVEVQEVPTSYDQSPYDQSPYDFGVGGEGHMPPFSYVHSYNQHSGQYMYPSSPSQRSLSRNSNHSQRSSKTPSPMRGGRGGRGSGGRGSQPSSRSSSRESHNNDDRSFSSVTGRNSATLRAELEAWDQSLGQPDSVASRRNNTTGSQSHRSRSGSNRSSGRRRANSRNSNASGADTPNSQNSNPQNLSRDRLKKFKVKTELCSNYKRGMICKYGDGCNFAHGEEDLKIRTLLELDNGGITDVEIYRTRVCFTWVATGSCPFQQRCGGLHDPRVIGPEEHWLPHAEMDHNSILSGRNIDKCHHQHLASIYNCSPIYGYVPPARWKEGGMETMAAWKHFYSYICNISPHPTPDSQEPTELARVFMAIKMREDRVGQMYSYLPTHCLTSNDSPSELCMVLQKKTFAVPRCAAVTSNEILDITGDETYINDPRKIEKYHIHSAHLIAFGPMGDPESRNLSVFYDLSEDDIRECTKQKSKTYKRSRHLIEPSGNRDGGRTPKIEEISTESYRQQQLLLSLRLVTNDNRRDGGNRSYFYNYQPVDNDAYDLVTDILKHRVRYLDSMIVLLQASGSTTRNQFRIRQEEEHLKSRFESLRRHWMTWSWPVRSGVDKIDGTTPIPDVDGEYYFGLEDPTNFQSEMFFGVDKYPMKPDIVYNPTTKAAVAFLWESFLLNCQIIRGNIPNLRLREFNSEPEEKRPSTEALASVNAMYTNLRRLHVFRLLSLGVKISDYNEIMELPLLSPRECTPSPEVLELLSPRRTPLPQSIPNMMKTFFMEWDDLIADPCMKNKGPFSNDGEGGEQPASVEEESRNTWMVSPVAINDDHIIAYLSSAAAKGTRSIADGTE